MAWTLPVIEAGDWSTRSGRRLCAQQRGLSVCGPSGVDCNVWADEVDVGRACFDGLEHGLSDLSRQSHG